MQNFLDNNRLHHLLGWALLGLLLLLLALEGWRYGVKPSPANNEQVVERSLERAADFFLNQQKELLNKSENLAATLQSSLIQQKPRSSLYYILQQFPELWSVSLYRGGQPVVWKGFALQKNKGEAPHKGDESAVEIARHNNIIYLEGYVPFSVKDSAGTSSYSLYTGYRVEQSNPLPIGGRSEFNIFNSGQLVSAYPLSFSIFSSRPDDIIQSQQLSNLAGDSVGIVYATADEFQQTQAQWEQSTRFWRSLYSVFCFTVLALLLFGAADRLPAWKGLALQLFFIGGGWAIFTYTDMPSHWILAMSESPAADWVDMVEKLSSICINVVFALLASISIARKLSFYKYRIEASKYLSTLGLAGFFGVISALSIPVLFVNLYDVAVSVDIPLLGLRIFPGWSTVILYLSLGMAIFALGLILVALNRLLFRITREHFKFSASVQAASFITALFVAQLYFPSDMVFNWVFAFSILSFTVVMGLSVGYFKNIGWIKALSPLRKIVVFSMMAALAGIPVLYQASLDNTDEELWKTAVNYSQEEDPFAAELTRQLLTNLEMEFREITLGDLGNNQSSLQARFTQTIQSFLSPRWNAYSFDLQLINRSGEVIADYATDLNSPNWVKDYNISALKSVTEIQQITKSTIRPVVQLPQLINQEDYRTFYRGWIPVFGKSDETPIAWILCSIYQERPEFNKPVRAVMASLTYEDWNTAYLMQKYENGNLLNSAQQGFAGYFPKHQALSQNMLQALQNDTLIYFNENTEEYSYRTLLWKESENQTIKISTTLADYRVILFSFFRFNFILLLAGCLALLPIQLFTLGRIRFLGKNNRFQDRILDSFLLATLLFLVFLVATSHYAIKQQNQDIVRQELFNKLESLSKAIESNSAIQNNADISASFSLDSMTTPLNVDATFYSNRMVTETTTPQIYQQHLLPAALPFEIYTRLFIEQQRDAYSTVNLGGQPLLIGYRSILDAQNNPVAAIAIPTFLESPKYSQQLLQTTSYLILIYLLIFGLFILGSALISQKLTRPLSLIQQGLNKISGGSLNTTIPVTSRDEIGSLAKAYNNMVARLQKLQKELASAEREAAWKEMAQQVAHEIKNPLTPMKLNVQHLERQLKADKYEPEELKRRIQKITANLIEQIQSLSNIASDFSKFSQPLEEEFTKVDIAQILSSVADLYKHDENVDILFRSQARQAYVNGIADELKRVIINLVKNAYEAMPDGGEISFQLYKKQQHIFIEVEDNGEGIPESDRPNIFVPNFSTKSSGTGLGLAICKKIVEAHEGSITFASVEGEGTTFVIKLPEYRS